MKLNHDCVRDFLIDIEKNLHYGNYIDVGSVKMEKYDKETILYVADKLIEVSYLNGTVNSYINNDLPTITINSISWEGHKFLDNIRDDGIWNDTKNVLSKFSSVSLGLVSNVASQVISALIKSQLNL